MKGTGNPVGRPTVMTPDTVKKLEEAFLLGCTDLEACLVADISKETLYNYQDKNPEFVGRKEKLKLFPIYRARASVMNGIDDPDLALKFLERKKKDEFSLRTENDTTIRNPEGESFKTDANVEVTGPALDNALSLLLQNNAVS